MRNQLLSISKHLGLKSLRLMTLVVVAAVAPFSSVHATWSVVAVNPLTGEVGAAGASCYHGVDSIAGIVPGKGVVVAQGLTSDAGRDHATQMLREGNAAGRVVDMITSSEVDKSFFVTRQLRQYGVASLHDGAALGATRWRMFWREPRIP
jgi:hypothetical protein